MTTWKVPKRYIVVMMVFIGYVHSLFLQANIGMVVVELTSVKDFIYENGTVERKPEYNWSSQQKALVLGSFAYGRLLCLIGGRIVERLGGSTLYAIGILSSAVTTLLTPYMLQTNLYLFIFARALSGTFESFTSIGTTQLWSRWIPPDERAKCISVSLNGTNAGAIVSFVVAGWMLNHWGWKALFYVTGTASFTFFCIWSIIVKNDPTADKHMSDEEREYIKEKLNTAVHTEKLVYPWKDILTCVPFWVICICKFCTGCGNTFLWIHLPQYIKDNSDLDIEKVGYISVFPQVCAVIALPLAGCLSGYLRSNKILSNSNQHKLFISIGSFLGSITLLVIGLWSNFSACIIFLCMFQFLLVFPMLHLHIIVLDLGSRYAGLLYSITYFFYTLACISTPVLVGFLVTSHSQLQWRMCILILSGMFISVGLIFLRFGSGEVQPWANYSHNKYEKEIIQDIDLLSTQKLFKDEK